MPKDATIHDKIACPLCLVKQTKKKKKQTNRWREHVTLSLLVNFLNILTPLSPIQTMENRPVTMATRKHVLFDYTQCGCFPNSSYLDLTSTEAWLGVIATVLKFTSLTYGFLFSFSIKDRVSLQDNFAWLNFTERTVRGKRNASVISKNSIMAGDVIFKVAVLLALSSTRCLAQTGKL